MGEFVTTSEGAFEDCTSLASISLDTSVAHLGESAFPDWDSLSPGNGTSVTSPVLHYELALPRSPAIHTGLWYLLPHSMKWLYHTSSFTKWHIPSIIWIYDVAFWFLCRFEAVVRACCFACDTTFPGCQVKNGMFPNILGLPSPSFPFVLSFVFSCLSLAFPSPLPLPRVFWSPSPLSLPSSSLLFPWLSCLSSSTSSTSTSSSTTSSSSTSSSTPSSMRAPSSSTSTTSSPTANTSTSSCSTSSASTSSTSTSSTSSSSCSTSSNTSTFSSVPPANEPAVLVHDRQVPAC